MATTPRIIGQDFVRSQLVEALLPVVDDMAGAPSLEDGARDIVAAIELVCTLIPLAGGPVMVETRAWEDAVAQTELAMQVERLALSEEVDDGYRERVVQGIFTALFPAGIVVAKKVGRVTVNCEVIKAALEPNTSVSDIIEGCVVAVIEEVQDAD